MITNTCPQAYKFTGKERDAETNLDFFIARYYSSGYGRFLVPDPENAGAFRSDPQSWNAYGYVTNNSLNYIDPFGLAKTDANGVWVGEFHGEKDCSTDHGCLFWNEDAQQWESEAPHPRWPTMWEGMWHAFMLIPNGAEILLRKAAESGSPPFGLSDADMLAIETGIGLPGPGTFGRLGRLLPKAARTFDNVTDAFRHLEKYHGVSSILAGERLHKIKASAGLGPADDVLIDRTGGVWHSKTREFLGSLTEGGAKTVR